MLKNLLQNKAKIVLILVLIFSLIGIRLFEKILFYDPFLEFFKGSSSTNLLPKVDNLKLFFGLFSRYFLNTIISLTIIYVLYKDLDITKFASFLYILFFIILITAFFITIIFFSENKMQVFYIRRFLIQPIFLLLFVPAFYFQKQVKN